MALVLLSLFVLKLPAAVQVSRPDPSALLDVYLQGRYEESLAAVRHATRDGARDLRQRLVLAGTHWVDAAASDRIRRALAAAAFALESERILAERGEWPASDEQECAGRCVVEWACTLLQTRGSPDEGERIWMLASIALAGGVRDWRFLQTPLSRPSERIPEGGHVHHAIARLPNEPRVRFARAVALASRHTVIGEMDTPRDGARTASIANTRVSLVDRAPTLVAALEQRLATQIDYVKQELEALASEPSVGAEARIRSGYLHWVQGDEEGALVTQRAAADATNDPDVKYVASFLAAQAAQALGDLRAAEAYYRAALSARPHSQSATLGLSALLYSRGEASQAYDLVDASRSGRPRDDDPWRMFLYGDFARLPMLVAELRRLVAR